MQHELFQNLQCRRPTHRFDTSDITELGLIVIDTTAIRNELIEKHDVSIYIIMINQKKADYKKQIKTPKTRVYNTNSIFFFFFL